MSNLSVWKFAWPSNGAFKRAIFPMPRDAEVLCVQLQHGVPTIWALVDTDQKTLRPRKFDAFYTGEEVHNGPYIGTLQMGGGNLVLHIFEDES